MKALPLASALAFFAVAPLLAGVFEPAGPEHLPQVWSANLITHTFGYTGAPGDYIVEVCVGSGASAFAPALSNAIAIWNAREAMVGNCSGQCTLVELQSNPGTYDAGTVLLHELGHCAFGLGHTNYLATSFTSVRNVSVQADGGDGARGSRDDVVSPQPGIQAVHWFGFNNDPFSLVSGNVDETSYTRDYQDLPIADAFIASANKAVADVLSYPGISQSVMYSTASPLTVFHGLTADQVNMIRFAESGLDTVVSPLDDYSVEIVLAPDCSTADVVLDLEQNIDPDSPELGRCELQVAGIPISGQTLRHYRIYNSAGNFPIRLVMNSRKQFSFFVFVDDFELGDTSVWSATVP